MQPTPPVDASVHMVRRWIADELAAAAVASPEAEARLIMAAILGCEPGRVVLYGDTQLTAAQLALVRAWVAQRAARIPLQHILGEAPFLDFSVAVGEGVFIPRPETELLADWAIKALRQREKEGVAALDGRRGEELEEWPQRQRQQGEQVGEEPERRLHILDLCAGSGVLAIALARAFPTARVWAVERAAGAVAYLRRNVAALAPQVSVVVGDVAELHPRWGIPARGIDMVVCNPPYVPQRSLVDVETVTYDPPEAVFSGSDGLSLSTRIMQRLPLVLADGALLGMEHDDTTGGQLCQVAQAAGYSDCRDHPDLAGRPRFMTARWAGCTQPLAPPEQ